MRRKVFLLSVFAVFALLTASARAAEISLYSMTFDIQASGEVKESIHVTFSQEVNASYFTYMFAGDISGLKITDGREDVQYSIESTGTESMVRLLVPSGARELFISFVSRDLVFWNGNIMQFFTDFHPPAGLARADITVILPQGFSVYRDMVSPENHTKATDGASISLSWSIENPAEVPVSVKIYNPYQSTDFLLLPVVVTVFAAGFAWLFFWNRKKTHHAFLKGFTEDERRTVEILRTRRSCYQNRLEKELGFSKAKMTRITQRLEKKGVIEREKTGRTKRIEWKG